MNLPETAKLQEIYGETEVSGARFKDLADHFENTLLQPEELKLSETIQITMVVK